MTTTSDVWLSELPDSADVFTEHVSFSKLSTTLRARLSLDAASLGASVQFSVVPTAERHRQGRDCCRSMPPYDGRKILKPRDPGEFLPTCATDAL